MKARISAATAWLLMLILLLPAAAAAKLPPTVFTDGGYLISKEQRIIMARHQDRLLVPASTWKIVTALLALEQLGPDFRFQTDFYHADGHLFIKGFGDPMLTSEEAARIAAALAAAGVKKIQDIVVDDSFFQLEQANPAGSGASLRSYDAANGALAVNFNTVKIEVPTAGPVRSAEPQTPSLPVMQQMAGNLPPGVHRVNLSQHPEQSRRYSGELFQHLLTSRNIRVDGVVRGGVTPAGAEPIYRHLSSQALTETVQAMLLYSNNFIANQLFLVAGARQSGKPATWARGRRNLRDYLEESGLAPESFRVAEGSGLSRKNLISPRALLQVLEKFRPYAELLPRWQEHLVKSGTLNGVYAYAGYFRAPGQLDPFVLILNQAANTRDQALELLAIEWQGQPSATASR